MIQSVYTHGRPYAHGQSFALISYLFTDSTVCLNLLIFPKRWALRRGLNWGSWQQLRIEPSPSGNSPPRIWSGKGEKERKMKMSAGTNAGIAFQILVWMINSVVTEGQCQPHSQFDSHFAIVSVGPGDYQNTTITMTVAWWTIKLNSNN